MDSASEKQMAVQPFELLLDQATIDKRVADLGAEITRDYVESVHEQRFRYDYNYFPAM